jgi:hypothetical protein
MNKLAILLVVAFSLTAFPWVGAQEPTSKPDPIVGEWIWNDNMDITVNADGTVNQRGDGAAKWSAKWRLLESRSVERKYEFNWTRPNGSNIIDTLTLSSDGKKLEGKNQQKHRVGGRRVEH